MLHSSSALTCLIAGLLSGLLMGCGASRSNKFKGSCSSLKSIADRGPGAPKALRAGETYDPSAVMLVFRAQSDKISIESRCNARLVHTLTVKNAASPVDFNAVKLQLSSVNSNSLELHTSAHCFFRVWDSRVPSQVKHNHQLSEAAAKKILSDDFERYKLYKSLLASPQKLFAFSSSGEPIEFEYKLKNATDVYAQFFEKIEKYDIGVVRKYIGREFSKTSVMLDELALDVCSADENLMKRATIDLTHSTGAQGIDESSLQALKKETSIKDFVRRKIIHNGKHKICFSQSDMVVAPITLTQSLSAKQKDLIQAVHVYQSSKVSDFETRLDDSLKLKDGPRTENIYWNSEDDPHRLTTEYYAGTKPAPLSNSCGWMNEYPALSVTHPVMSDVAEGLKQWKEIKENDFQGIIQHIATLFPAAAGLISIAGGATELKKKVNAAPKDEACRVEGGQFNENTVECTPRAMTSAIFPKPEHNYCPPGDPVSSNQFRIEAARVQLNVNASLRLAMVSTLQSLGRYRAASDEILLLPLASLYGTTRVESRHSSSAAQQVFKKLLEMNQDAFIGERTLIVEKVDEETIPICSLKSVGTPLGAGQTKVENVSAVFENFSDFSLSFMKSELKSQSFSDNYANFAMRYLNTRCIGASTQLLYNGFEQMPGLLQKVSFADVSMVASGSLPSNGHLSHSTQDMLETGRSISLPFGSMILGHEFADKKFPQQIGSKLMVSGHLQVGYCVASDRVPAPEFSQFIPDFDEYIKEVSAYKDDVRDKFCEAMPGHREYVEYVKDHKSKYETTPDSLKPVFDELASPISPFIYEKLTTKAVADALPRMFGHINFVTAIPHWVHADEKAKYGPSVEYTYGFENASGRYFLTAGDSGTTLSVFGLFPMFMLSTVQDVPVSGGIAVVPSTSGQDVQSGKGSNCR